MCLTNEKQTKKVPGLGTLLPLLDHKQACDPKFHIQALKNIDDIESVTFVPIDAALSAKLGEYAFALKMSDDSMVPEMRPNDVQIIDPFHSPNPGDYVAVKIKGKQDVFICQYKQLSYVTMEFELLTLNDKWPNITVNENVQVEIIGKIVQNIRSYV